MVSVKSLQVVEDGRTERIRFGKGKWRDKFLDATFPASKEAFHRDSHAEEDTLDPVRRYRRKVNQVIVWRQRRRPKSHPVCNSESRRPRFKTMVDLSVASGEHSGTNLEQGLIMIKEGKARTHYVSVLSHLRGGSRPCAGLADR